MKLKNKIGHGLISILAVLGGASPIGACVHLTNQSDRWWLVDSEGGRFLSLGVNHVQRDYWPAASDPWVASSYGKDLFLPNGEINDGSSSALKWAETISRNLNRWGFNTLGMHTDPLTCLYAQKTLYFVVELKIPVSWGWNMKRHLMHEAFKKNAVDVFSPEFAAVVESNAGDAVARYRHHPRVLGYAYTDGPPWTVDADEQAEKNRSLAEKTIHPWVLALMQLPSGAAGKQAWIETLRTRYRSTAAAASVYGIDVSGWGGLAMNTKWQNLADPKSAEADSAAFLLQIIRQWYTVRQKAVRRFDDEHLILGDKLNVNRDAKNPDAMAAYLRIMRDYVDINFLQYYADFPTQLPVLERIHAETGKPIINGDTTYLRNSPGQIDDERSRVMGETYARDLRSLFSLPYYIGFHHCGYISGWSLPYRDAVINGDPREIRRLESKKYRPGFVDDHEKEHATLMESIIRIVEELPAIHAGSNR